MSIIAYDSTRETIILQTDIQVSKRLQVYIGVLPRNRSNWIYRYKDIYYKKLACTIIEADKSEDLQGRSKRADGDPG